MYRWAVRKLTGYVLRRLRDGDAGLLLRLVADDVHFRFLGQHSWAADYHSKQQVRVWLERYLQTGLRLEPQEIVVSGPPWNTRVCTLFADRAERGGEVIYENEGVLFERVVWGRIREHISYEDTQRTQEFDVTLGVADPDSATN